MVLSVNILLVFIELFCSIIVDGLCTQGRLGSSGG